MGNIAGYGYIIGKFLRERGMAVDLYVSRYDLSFATRYYQGVGACEDWVIEWDSLAAIEFLAPSQRGYGIHFALSSLSIVWRLRAYDVVIAFAIPSIYALLSGRPYIANANGSDIRELAREKSVKGRLMLRTYRQARRVLLWNVDHIRVAADLGLGQAQFIPVAIDTDKFSPSVGHVVDADLRHCIGDALLVFTPTAQDWVSPEGSRWRKCNDLLFRAFARFVDEGNDAFLVYLDRGMDKTATVQLIEELGIGDRTASLQTLDKDQLCNWFRAADVIVDQFEIGSFGGIALEAMACGRPLITYIDQEAGYKAYGDEIPILNARTEDDIYRSLVECLSVNSRYKLGERARKWILKHHRWQPVIDIINEEIAGIRG